MRIKKVVFTENGVEKFNSWFRDVAKPSLSLQEATAVAISDIHHRIGSDSTPMYKLIGRFTKSGETETIKFEDADLSITPA